MDREYGTPLRQIVAAYVLDDGAPYFAVEVDYLEEEFNHASSLVLRFPDPDERDNWLRQIRAAANAATLADPNPMSPYNHQMAARVVESERDYDPSSYAIFKVVQRASKSGLRSSSHEDLTKVGSTVCFLAIGLHRFHLISLFKKHHFVSTPQVMSSSSNNPKSYGILALTGIRISPYDDTFDLTFRNPFQPQKVLRLASLASRDIAARFRQIEDLLRPEWETRPYSIDDPDHIRADSMLVPFPSSGLDTFDKTLIGYCVAYDIRPDNIRYTVKDDAEDGPRFELLPPSNIHRKRYTELELLAILRSLRYNESYGSISFANVQLDVLNELYDGYGNEHVCMKTKRGTPLRMSYEEQCSSRLLVQEMRALAITNKKLRRMNFSHAITRKPQNSDEGNGERDLGCGVVEAVFPLCKLQITNVDWITLNGIQLGETDLDYLVGSAVDRSCHFRALEMSNCGLNDRGVMLLLDSFRAQDSTLETMDISKNAARLSPTSFSPQLGVFGFLRRLNLSHLSRTSDPESLIPLDTIMSWRLEELILSGTSVNAATLDVICRYLLSSKSDLLRELRLDHTNLSGRDIAMIIRASGMPRKRSYPGGLPLLHVDLSQNKHEKEHQQLTAAIRESMTPALLTIRLMEYEEEANFRDLVSALTNNTTITHLDISRASLPLEASEDTCRALERLFSDNHTLQYLDISGEDSRLESSKIGVGINEALCGLKLNTSLRCLRIQSQNLGLRGAHTIADIINVNTTLQELHCEKNGIPLSGFMDIVNALQSNRTLLHLSGVEDSQSEAHHVAELQIKAIREEPHYSSTPISKSASIRNKVTSRVSGEAKRRSIQPTTKPAHRAANEALEALGDLDKVWNKQITRLQSYIYRNQCIASGAPYDEPIEPSSPRPPAYRSSSAMTIEKILQSVDTDATPRIEKEVYLEDGSVAGTQRGLLDGLDEPIARTTTNPMLQSVPESEASPERPYKLVHVNTF